MKNFSKPALKALSALAPPAVLRTFVLPAVLAASALLAAGAHAQSERRDTSVFPLELATLEARSAERFARFDSNADGLINAEEFAANAQQLRAANKHGKGKKHHKRSHHNKDDRATLQTELFSALDSDNNGELSSAEFARSRVVRKALWRQKHIAHKFEKLDTNKDAQLTLDEFQQRLQKLRALDSNADGTLSKEELRAGRKAGRTRS